MPLLFQSRKNYTRCNVSSNHDASGFRDKYPPSCQHCGTWPSNIELNICSSYADITTSPLTPRWSCTSVRYSFSINRLNTSISWLTTVPSEIIIPSSAFTRYVSGWALLLSINGGSRRWNYVIFAITLSYGLLPPLVVFARGCTDKMADSCWRTVFLL